MHICYSTRIQGDFFFFIKLHLLFKIILNLKNIYIFLIYLIELKQY